ncbi:hypothetical protein L489_0071 [Bordetella bronchiseptica 00-P-2730]|nr:hypothetical protein L489_0071 [Bordetella bronchiseptica 00-P-2730]
MPHRVLLQVVRLLLYPDIRISGYRLIRVIRAGQCRVNPGGPPGGPPAAPRISGWQSGHRSAGRPPSRSRTTGTASSACWPRC